MAMRRRRLFWQIALTSFCIAVPIAIVLGGYVAHRAGNSCEEQAWSKLETAADACVLRLAGTWTADGPPQLADICRELSERLGVRVSVILPTGKVIADSGEDPAVLDNHRERPEVVRALAGGIGRSTRPSASRQEPYMYLAMPLRRDGRIVAVVRTVAAPVAADRRPVDPGRGNRRGGPAGGPGRSPPAVSSPRGGWSAPSTKSAAAPSTSPAANGSIVCRTTPRRKSECWLNR